MTYGYDSACGCRFDPRSGRIRYCARDLEQMGQDADDARKQQEAAEGPTTEHDYIGGPSS